MTIAAQSATSLTDAIRAGTLTAAALMEASYDRIAALNPVHNAIHSLMPRDGAMALAQAADQAEAKGPLHGLPLAVKDLSNAAGLPTTHGVPHYANNVSGADDIHIARLRAAGAIIVGKTNTPEFGFGSHSTNRLHGPTRNAYDPARSAGGSSGGAGVALAMGMMPIADGSDMMGSLRNPAAWNGVYGLRPSFGRVPSEPGTERFFNMLSTNGPMARTPRDLALLLDVMSGPDPGLFHGREFSPTLPAMEVATGSLRMGWLGDWGGSLPFEEGLLAAHERALGTLETLGHRVENLMPPISREAMWQSWTVLRALSNAATLAEEPLDALNAQCRWEVETGRALSAPDILEASTIRTAWFAAALDLFERYDVLVSPVAQLRPFPVAWDWPSEIAGTVMDTYHRWMEVVIPASLVGLPVLAIPAGIDSGLPFGLQLIGPPGSDARLLQIARDWHDHGFAPDLPI